MWHWCRSREMCGAFTWPTREMRGRCTCTACGYAGGFELRWPESLYWRVELDGVVLWARHRQHMVGLRRYIAMTRRRTARSDELEHAHAPVGDFKLPRAFITAKR